jgi:hypothetical protein
VHRVLRVHGKGDEISLVPLPPAVSRAIDRAIDGRECGPTCSAAPSSRQCSMRASASVTSRSQPGTQTRGQPCDTTVPGRTSTVTPTTSSRRTWPREPNSAEASADSGIAEVPGAGHLWAWRGSSQMRAGSWRHGEEVSEGRCDLVWGVFWGEVTCAGWSASGCRGWPSAAVCPSRGRAIHPLGPIRSTLARRLSRRAVRSHRCSARRTGRRGGSTQLVHPHRSTG